MEARMSEIGRPRYKPRKLPLDLNVISLKGHVCIPIISHADNFELWQPIASYMDRELGPLRSELSQRRSTRSSPRLPLY
ncbi:hypothetical protein EVAR_80647_1 [Eumeta japonica]|uniref:Uncharacterized protein n=1 Tax=Eumeta variegata TaxID=151549 RepID=A0A4C1YW76_EUMVA|nr:hypothetical protein EVAR_80647_1 [Eumeta japonica]